MRRPREHIVALQQAATEVIKSADPSLSKELKTVELQVGFEGSFGPNSLSPRGLLSNLLNSMVEVEGIVTKCSSVRPKLVKSVQWAPVTGQYTQREYRDAMSMDIGIEVNNRVRMPTPAVIQDKDAAGNELELEHGLCQYKNYQMVTLQEMPERARVGQLPRSVELILENDLVDHVKPGDRVLTRGVYRPLSSMQDSAVMGTFRTVLIVNNIQIIGKEVGAVTLTGNDVGNIREVSKRPNVLDIMAQSLCPSIFGHSYIKKALVLQLLGGRERNLENGTHLRGDINVLMVGDPSTAKSQLLRSVLDIAPLAISTTGRGSSGVGLTAAVTMDPETGEKRLEAGAMVLADRGVVCIDEFDKMGENDRVAIHEVMEQQTVTIAKAGIHASLNARCSVVAAANPVYGQYDKSRRPTENIGLPDSLLSRFDLLFIVLDQLDPVLDRRLSEHVLRSHQYRRPGTIMEPEPLNQVSTLSLDDPTDNVLDAPVWQRVGRGAAAASSSSSSSSSGAGAGAGAGTGASGEILTKDFLRKYLYFAKNRIHPELSDDAMEGISEAYAGMRGKQSSKNLPVTARTLETLIRLSSAHARARLSATVTTEDVEAAVELVNFVLFHDIGTDEADVRAAAAAVAAIAGEGDENRAAAANMDVGGGGGDDDDDDDDDDDNNSSRRRRSSQGAKKREIDTGDSSFLSGEDPSFGDLDDPFGSQTQSQSQSQSSQKRAAVVVDRRSARYELFTQMLHQHMKPDQPMSDSELLALINRGLSVREHFSAAEADAMLRELAKENKVRSNTLFHTCARRRPASSSTALTPLPFPSLPPTSKNRSCSTTAKSISSEPHGSVGWCCRSC